MQTFDIIVIGTGGGLKIALPCAQRGLRVALIEADDFGGTCLNRGCIPSKMLVHPAELADLVRLATPMGLHADHVRLDFPAIMERIARDVGGIRDENRSHTASIPNITLISGHGRFVEGKVIEVNGCRLTAPLIFLAVGSGPNIPAIDGLEDVPYMTSKEALLCKKLPGSLCVVGAGYIACELGYAYASAGADVSFIVRSQFLRGIDRDIVTAFEAQFALAHHVYRGAAPTSVRLTDRGIEVQCGPPSSPTHRVCADALLLATGVAPLTHDLGLEHTGVSLDQRGYIEVDSHLQTGQAGVYALGDCVGNYMFRHTVNYEGEYLMRHLFDGDSAPLDYGPVPYAVFTHPQVAGVGATEAQLRDAGIDYVRGSRAYADSTPGMARCSTNGFVKVLVARGQGHRILGAHIVGEEAATMIHLFIAAIKLEASLQDLLDMIFIHPALPEVARDACRDARAKLAQ